MSNLLSTTWERVYFKDPLSRFLFVSAGWIEAYAPGRDPGELRGKTDFDVFSQEHAPAALAASSRSSGPGSRWWNGSSARPIPAGRLGVHDEDGPPQ